MGARPSRKLQTISIDGNIQCWADSKPGTYSLRMKQPNRYYSEIRTEGKTLIESYNGKSAWHQIEAGENSTMLGPQALETGSGRAVLQRPLSESRKKENRRGLQGASPGAWS